ncbi:AI-2E family transporter [Mesorhizobium sp. M0830]|uniref:AI-2E family transporter n=1 Tax=Mesorhizobium sp. M0830 TaxID=2957008 RepID=UPI00333AA4E8
MRRRSRDVGGRRHDRPLDHTEPCGNIDDSGPQKSLLLLDGDWGKALILTAWGGIVVGGIDNVLRPMLVGNQLRLHTIPAFISMISGLALFGASGFILGPLGATCDDAARRGVGGALQKSAITGNGNDLVLKGPADDDTDQLHGQAHAPAPVGIHCPSRSPVRVAMSRYRRDPSVGLGRRAHRSSDQRADAGGKRVAKSPQTRSVARRMLALAPMAPSKKSHRLASLGLRRSELKCSRAPSLRYKQCAQ